MGTDAPQHDPPDPRHTDAMVRMAKLWASAMPSVETFISASVTDPHDRDDVIQATSEYLARHFHEYREGTSFVAWAVSVARYRILELWRDRSRERLILSNEALDVVAEVAAESPLELSERHNALSTCIQQLGKHQQRLLEMRYTQAISPAQIGKQIGKPANTVSAALMRVRIALRKCVEARLGGDA